MSCHSLTRHCILHCLVSLSCHVTVTSDVLPKSLECVLLIISFLIRNWSFHRYGVSSTLWPKSERLLVNCWPLMKKTQRDCLKVYLSSYELVIVVLKYLACTTTPPFDALDLYIFTIRLNLLQVMLCWDVSYVLVYSMNPKWSSITFWVWKLKISLRDVCRHRSSSWVLQNLSITLEFWSVNVTSGT